MFDEYGFRREPIRSRQLLDSANGQPCTMEVPGICNQDSSTVVSAHIRDETFGMAQKADDCSSVHACFCCHTWLDQAQWLGKMAEVEVLRIIIRAIQRTIRNRVLRGFIPIKMDPVKPAAERKIKPRKPKDQRTKVSPSKPLAGRSSLPTGRRLQSANHLRKTPK